MRCKVCEKITKRKECTLWGGGIYYTYCSKVCQEAYKNHIRNNGKRSIYYINCIVCDKLVCTPAWGTIYCSRQCKRKNYKKAPIKTPKEIKCQYCNQVFQPYRSNTIYCSKRCLNIVCNKNLRIKRKLQRLQDIKDKHYKEFRDSQAENEQSPSVMALRRLKLLIQTGRVSKETADLIDKFVMKGELI